MNMMDGTVADRVEKEGMTPQREIVVPSPKHSSRGNY